MTISTFDTQGLLGTSMSNAQTKKFALSLLHADSEEEVIQILKDHGYWDKPDVWRNYGDLEGNFATIGNQQSRPEAALVEKIVNSVDARLMNACISEGIEPKSADAPSSIREAVDRFFPGVGGSLRNWTSAMRRSEAENITLAVTGAKLCSCITIADRGEGQTPDSVPNTFMSLMKSNKLRIKFVQGKFNMGGTGALKFCGEQRIQLLITRRNQSIVGSSESNVTDADCWSVTVTRRERPGGGAGKVRNSVFKYLAPIGSGKNPYEGEILRFRSQAMRLMPQYNKPYEIDIEHGSVIKLYNYDMKGYTGRIFGKKALMYRLEALLPEIALPVNLHECRPFVKGTEEKSFVTPIAGLTVRLEDGKGGNVEPGFPDSIPFMIRGEHMVAKIYAFKDGRASTYTTNEGVIFSINGQTHGVLPKTLFSRVRLSRLSSSLLVMVDCSKLSDDAREDLFMNSRDRLSQHQLRKEIQAEIEDILRKHPALKQLANDRKNEDIGERLANNKPLAEVLSSIIKSSPALAALFKLGPRLGPPFNKQSGGNQSGTKGKGRGEGEGEGPGLEPFCGKKHPTYFRFYKKKDGEMLQRNCEYGRRSRIKLETNVESEYFKRTEYPGRYDVEVLDTSSENKIDHIPQNSLLLHEGLGHWSIILPEEIEVGETITLQLSVNDDTLSEPFISVLKLTILPLTEKLDGSRGSRKSSTRGGIGERKSGIDIPVPILVKREEWTKYDFDERSACKVLQENDGTFTYYINIDNRYLLYESKYGKMSPELIKAKFIYGNVLVALALIQYGKQNQSHKADQQDSDQSTTVEDQVNSTSRALAPFIIPMINYLGALSQDDVAVGAMAEDDV